MSSHFLRQQLTRVGVFPGKTTRLHELDSLVADMSVQPIEGDLVRIGPARDGGYLLPDDLEGVDYCFSPGVAGCSDFERDLASRGMKIFLADRSVNGPATNNLSFRFIKRFIASSTVAEEEFVTMNDWYESVLGPISETSPEAILQMDIEGSEYTVLHSMTDALLGRFRIIVIELHRLHQFVDRHSFEFMSQALYKLLRTHQVVHIHPNNSKKVLRYGLIEIPATLEVTFWRRDRVKIADRELVFPHPLDHRCVAAKPEVTLPKCWYRPAHR